ncbi:ribulose-phosphate 3-epimerase [Vibrio sp. 10N.261.51.F12]|uniref:ribulose-phosphate 3-epimerase n=1 Tax=Vibrio sp. 10N.261.51.F12 TaxID=3229679 RepID=UPI00354D2F49
MEKSFGASLMVADPLNLNVQLKELESADIDFYHIDIMDGQFVNNFALSIDYIRSIKHVVTKPIDVHLMVENPERYIGELASVGVDIITVHAEAVTHLHGVLAEIKKHNIKAGVALNPSTSVESLDFVADMIDVLVVMTVNPGFAGQKFIDSMYKKVERAKDWVASNNLDTLIQVDGNIGHHSIPGCYDNGANMFVLGTSALFHNRGTLSENLKETRELV